MAEWYTRYFEVVVEQSVGVRVPPFAMIHLILCFLLMTPLFGIQMDSNMRSFEQREKKYRVDVYDFIGDYPHLEHIDIDARRKKNVELNLTGSYPVLERILYEGSFGTLRGKMTVCFPVLKQIDLLCGNTAMELDLRAAWKQSCDVHCTGAKERIILQLPKEVGVIAYVDTRLGAKVTPGPLKKQGWWRLTHRMYKNELADTAPVVLTFHIESTEAPIIFE